MMDEVLAFYGSKKEMAKQLNVVQSAISHWFKAGKIPAQQALKIEEQTNGEIKARDIA